MTDMNHFDVGRKEILISTVNSTDIDQILKFYEENLDTWKRFIKFWDWRQNQNPSRREQKAVAAQEAGEVVGCMSVNPVLLAANNQRIHASWQQDSLILKSMRGRGLGRKLIHEANKGFELTLAKGTSESMYALRKSDGYRDAPHPNYLVRVERPRPLKGRSWEGVAEYVIAQWRLFLPRPWIDKDIKISEIDSFDSSFNEFAASLAEEKVLRIFKDQQYLTWRYIQCPGKHYKIFRAGGKDARGAIVIGITGDNEGWIVDLVSTSNDKNCVDALLARALRYFRDQKTARIWTFATLPLMRQRLLRFGFLPTGRTPRFTYYWVGAPPLNENIILWDFWHGDGDLDLYM
jgi:L-amino acid N-acyltransferase YncA